jgi:hypothetical protein
MHISASCLARELTVVGISMKLLEMLVYHKSKHFPESFGYWTMMRMSLIKKSDGSPSILES